MIVKLLEGVVDISDNWVKLAVFFVVWSAFILIFYPINKWVKERNRLGIIALVLGIASPGSGFAYSAAYKRAWAMLILCVLSIILYFNDEKYGNVYVIVFLLQAGLGAAYANHASRNLRMKRTKDNQKGIEAAYLKDIEPYIASGHHLAVDTNFLMHFQAVLTRLYNDTNVHLFLHPTVFGELEGLKKSSSRDVRTNAQLGFDVLELYQTGERMQWTRKQKHGSNFSSADQRIIAGVQNEIQSGVKLVFASHDKGARILARSLHIPVVDPLQHQNKNKKIRVSV